MNSDAVYESIGDVSAYQFYRVILLGLAGSITGTQLSLAYRLLQLKTDFWCPVNAQNTTEYCYEQACSTYWAFDSSAFPLSWIIVIDRQYNNCEPYLAEYLVKSFYYITSGIGALILGYLADRIGRLRALLTGMIVEVIFSLTTSLSQGVVMFVVARAITAACVFGNYAISKLLLFNGFVLAIEMLPPKRRALAGVSHAVAMDLFAVIFASISLFIQHWSMFYTIVAIVNLVCIAIIFMMIPESPRWLLINERYSEARVVFESMARSQQTHLPAYAVYMFQRLMKEHERKRKAEKVAWSSQAPSCAPTESSIVRHDPEKDNLFQGTDHPPMTIDQLSTVPVYQMLCYKDNRNPTSNRVVEETGRNAAENVTEPLNLPRANSKRYGTGSATNASDYVHQWVATLEEPSQRTGELYFGQYQKCLEEQLQYAKQLAADVTLNTSALDEPEVGNNRRAANDEFCHTTSFKRNWVLLACSWAISAAIFWDLISGNYAFGRHIIDDLRVVVDRIDSKVVLTLFDALKDTRLITIAFCSFLLFRDLIVLPSVNKRSRRYAQTATQILFAACLIVNQYISEKDPDSWKTKVSEVVSLALIGFACIILYVRTCELSPTSHRCLVLGSCIFIGRLSSEVYLMFSYFFTDSNTAQIRYGFGVLALLGVVPSFLLPDTTGVYMPDVI